MSSSPTLALGVAKLESSGLTLAQANQLNIQVYDAAETVGSGITGFALPTLVINYMDPTNPREPLRPRPKHPPFKRLRFLGAEPMDAKNKPIKYIQAKDSGMCAYFPTLVDWPDIISDTEQPICITEGELKAAKACERGFPTIGLGGVDSFVSTTYCLGFLPELERIDWVRRRVFIVYDNDGVPKPEVFAAINRLALELEERGAHPFTCMLPLVTPPGKKTGLDDYFVFDPDPDHFQALLDSAESLTLAKPLWDMNEQVAVVLDPLMVVNKRTGKLYRATEFKDVAFANHKVPEQLVNKEGGISLKKVSVAAHWLQWPYRHQLDGITYAPGCKPIHEGRWNQWEGWGATPVKGDVSPFLRLIDHLFSNTTPEAKLWFLRWLAYPIQHAGAKMFTAAVLHGTMQGTGKSFVGYTMREVYGSKNFKEVKQKHLFGDFNGWVSNKQFVMGDDITGSDKREIADSIKNMITSKSLSINEKFLPEYEVPDCVNYFFTSQQPDGFFMDDTDRRLFIHEVPSSVLPFEFYKSYEHWLNTEAAHNALMHYFLHLPMGDFDHRAKAHTTEAKLAMIDIGRSDLGSWCHKLMEMPDSILHQGSILLKHDLHTSQELLAIYQTGPVLKTATANAVARNLKHLACPMVLKGQSFKVSETVGGRYFILRNVDKWLGATPAQIRAHLKGPRT